MKRAGIWFWMLLKRQLKKPSLYIVIICMVVCCFVIRSAASGFTVNLAVGIMNEDTGEKQAEDGDDAGIAADITELMESHRGLFRFVVYSDEEELKNDVRGSKVYAGYIFQKDFWKTVKDQNIKNSVKVISPKDSMIPKITNELVFSYVMQEYAYALLLYDTFDRSYLRDEDREEMADVLRGYYEENLTNGSTFSVKYHGAKAVNGNVKLDIFDYISPVIDGICAVMIFLAGLCGTITLREDKTCGTFARFNRRQTALTGLAEIFISVMITSAAAFAILIMTGRYAGTAGEVLHILLYAAGVTIYCFAVNLVIRNKTFFIAMTPVFLMASLLFCHIFLNLELLVPQLKYIAMFLPPSWF